MIILSFLPCTNIEIMLHPYRGAELWVACFPPYRRICFAVAPKWGASKCHRFRLREESYAGQGRDEEQNSCQRWLA